jgi:hypothetical protein
MLPTEIELVKVFEDRRLGHTPHTRADAPPDGKAKTNTELENSCLATTWVTKHLYERTQWMESSL